MNSTILEILEHSISIGDFKLLQQCCDDLLKVDGNQPLYYWISGLISLMCGEEEECQLSWLTSFDYIPEQENSKYSAEFSQIISHCVNCEYSRGQVQSAWLIRMHFQDFVPNDYENVMQICMLSAQLGIDFQDVDSATLLEAILNDLFKPSIDELHSFLEVIFLYRPHDNRLPAWIEFIFQLISEEKNLSYCSDYIFQKCETLGYVEYKYGLATDLMEIVVNAVDDNPRYWLATSSYAQKYNLFGRSIEAAQNAYRLFENPIDKVFSLRMKLSALLNSGGKWEDSEAVFNDCQKMLGVIRTENPNNLHRFSARQLLSICFFSPYIRDFPTTDRTLLNQIASLCEKNLQTFSNDYFQTYQNGHKLRIQQKNGPRKLKIGYICSGFRNHSVGWLARWLLKYHDQENFEIYAYSVNHLNDGSQVQQEYIQNADAFYILGTDTYEITEKIFQDSIDILIDLDSLTLDVTYEVISLKPSPIQATWLGWDALGMKSIDYFIADRYVLPSEADQYYVEKIVRLPNSYLSVDGFEVGVPNCSRDELGIPHDSVVFFTGQRGLKRNPTCCRLQLEIIKCVPNSYLLIKGISEQESLITFFKNLCHDVNLDFSRLIFIPQTPSETVHRANLRIADVVLDTYPYNGATTTLETLWMEVPIVTLVGEQFAARNSYTMMMNAGISEGIAWSAEEYVEWGIRLGTDSKLREEVCWKLRESKKTAPLWNAKQFTRHMEDAYQEMWKTYIDGYQSSNDVLVTSEALEVD